MGLKLFYGTLTVEPPAAESLEGAAFVEKVRTAPRYRLFSLDGFPVLVDDAEAASPLDTQIWEVPDELWAGFAASEPPLMVQDVVDLDHGRGIETLLGTIPFVEELGGVEVTSYGSWRAYRQSNV